MADDYGKRGLPLHLVRLALVVGIPLNLKVAYIQEVQ